MSSQFNTYSVEYSNQRHDDAYVRFERNRLANRTEESKINVDEWSDILSCAGKYDNTDASRCSQLASFDNPMSIFIHIDAGAINEFSDGTSQDVDDWCGAGVLPTDYDRFDRGIELEISQILVYALYFDECTEESRIA